MVFYSDFEYDKSDFDYFKIIPKHAGKSFKIILFFKTLTKI